MNEIHLIIHNVRHFEYNEDCNVLQIGVPFTNTDKKLEVHVFPLSSK